MRSMRRVALCGVKKGRGEREEEEGIEIGWCKIAVFSLAVDLDEFEWQ